MTDTPITDEDRKAADAAIALGFRASGPLSHKLSEDERCKAQDELLVTAVADAIAKARQEGINSVVENSASCHESGYHSGEQAGREEAFDDVDLFLIERSGHLVSTLATTSDPAVELSCQAGIKTLANYRKAIRDLGEKT